ncbi:polysaccharide deacetylase family protein [Aegicerativicinus sediminis]|uniref:polysaccharide deacetylase family protein n=1 Tax=Aegicerativicinus sediminis TaxID=2893202 RepID=UPI001E3639DC|nr:polysaccharide deacetylase family protein [Aegicerativicinus sediminis]
MIQYFKPFTFLCLLFLGINFRAASQETIASKLGYPADAKLLIIHADDLGVSHSENIATFEAIDNGSVNSASVMMPTPWVLEAVNYAKANPETHDFGLHLVLSSEWKNYKWGPVSSTDKVPSLIDEHGYFHEACRSDLNLKEVELELKAQVERAYAMGLEPTHLDTHMGCLAQTTRLTEVYLKIGQKYNLPVFVLDEFLSKEIKETYHPKVLVDQLYTISPEDYSIGPETYYTNTLKNLMPGLSLLLIHTAYDNEEMKGMNVDHPEWGNAWRQKDYDFFTSKTCKELLEKENIKLVTWRQIKEALY